MPILISDDRLFDTVDTLLTMQNRDGGFASYELVRGPSWLELLNPAEVFGELILSTTVFSLNRAGNIMIEYEYPECTTSVITSLSIFRKHHPSYRAKEIA